jgi:hypothetical protein
MPETARPEMFMPVSDEGAALQFFVEAMKANTATLQSVGKAMQGIQDEQKETLRLVHDTRERVIRIESGGQTELVAQLQNKVEAQGSRIDGLERKEDRREGAGGAVKWLFPNGQTAITALGFIILAIIVLQANGKM